jgi:pentose-5-phosphate-3-epimerase
VTKLEHCAFSTGHLAHPIADVGGELSLSIYAAPPHLRTAIALRAMQEGLWIHVDIMRDPQGRDRGVDMATLKELTVSRQHRVDVHLIGDGAAAAFDEVCELGCTRITVALEGCTDILSTAATARRSGAQFWMAIAPPTAVEDFLPMVPVVDGVLLMLLAPGTQDPADLSLLSKAQALSHLLPVGVDGSVGAANVNACLEAGARYIVSGRGLLQPNQRFLKTLTPLQSKGKP